MSPIIGFCGPAGSGKDLSAAILSTHARFTRLAFADALKVEARAQGWNGEKDEQGRRLLQTLGTEARAEDPEHWIRPIEKLIVNRTTAVAVTDVRYLNEMAMIRSHGGLIIELDRPGAGLDGDLGAHSSEQEWRTGPRDYVVHNRTGVKDLMDLLLEIVDAEWDGWR